MITPPKTNIGRGAVLKDGAAMLVAQLLARILNFGFFFILARSLPIGEFGVLNLALSIIIMADIVIDMGLSRYAMREISKAPNEAASFMAVILPYKAVAVFIFFGVMAVAVLMSNQESSDKTIFLVAALGIFLIAPSMVFENVLQANRRFARIASAHLALSITQFAVGCLALLAGLSTVAIAFTFAISNLVYCTIMLVGVRSVVPLWNWDWPVAKLMRLIPPAFPYLCSAFITMLAMRAELFVLGYFGSDADLGVFSMAVKIIEASLLLPIVLGSVMAPRYSVAHVKDRSVLTSIYSSSMGVMLLLAIPCAGIAYFMTPLVPLILNRAAFEELDALLKVMFIGYPAACVYLLNTFVLFGAVRQRWPIILMAVLVVLQIAIAIIMQSLYGLWGAAVGFAIFMNLAAVASTIFLVIRYTDGLPVVTALFLPLSASAVALSLVFIYPAGSAFITLPVFLAGFVTTALILRWLLPVLKTPWQFEPE